MSIPSSSLGFNSPTSVAISDSESLWPVLLVASTGCFRVFADFSIIAVAGDLRGDVGVEHLRGDVGVID